MSNEKLIEGLREVQKFGAYTDWSETVALIDQAIAALSTESIDVERLRALIAFEDQVSEYFESDNDVQTKAFLRQLLRIAEGESKP